MAAAKALDKKWLFKELDRDHRRKAREKLAELRLSVGSCRGPPRLTRAVRASRSIHTV
jgi:hypothetical protein